MLLENVIINTHQIDHPPIKRKPKKSPENLVITQKPASDGHKSSRSFFNPFELYLNQSGVFAFEQNNYYGKVKDFSTGLIDV